MISKRVLGAGAAVAMMFGVADAQAQWFVTPTGPGVLYFGVEGGWTHLNSPTDSVGGFKFKEHFDDGFKAGARARYRGGAVGLRGGLQFGEKQPQKIRR